MSVQNGNQLNLFVARLAERSALDEEESDALLALPAQPLRLGRKRDFVHLDEPTSSAYLIASGMAGRFIQTSSGMRQFTAFHIPGDMVDLHSAVRPVGIGGLNALCDTTILRVPHSALRAVAARFPAIAEAFWRDCMLDAAVLMQWTVNIGRRDARTRLAHLLCEMAVRFGRGGSGTATYPFPVTQEQLGDAAALTAVHVNRSLKTLRDLAFVKGGSVRIRDWAALARAGEFDASYLVADAATEAPRRLLATA